MKRKIATKAVAMQREHKAFPLSQFKALDDAEGHFSGYLSTFNNTDQQGDAVKKGAFVKTIAEADKRRKSHEKPFLWPLLWNHHDDFPIGGFTDAREDTHGLYVEGQIDLNTQKGREVWSGLKMGYIPGLSIGYDTIKRAFVNGVRELLELRLWEGSAVTFPANDEALVPIDGVKSAHPMFPSGGAVSLEPWQREAIAAFIAQASKQKGLSFNDALALAQSDLQEQWHDTWCALVCSVASIMRDPSELSKPDAIATSVEQFAATLRTLVERSIQSGFVPRLDWDNDSFADSYDDGGMAGEMSADGPDEAKAGRVMSATNHEAMGKALGKIADGYKSLSDMHANMSPKSSSDDTQDNGKANQRAGANEPTHDEPTAEDLLKLTAFRLQLARERTKAAS